MRYALLWLIAISYVSAIFLASVTGLAIDYQSWLIAEAPAILANAALVIYVRSKGYQRIQGIAETFLFQLLLIFPACAAPYIAMHLAFPLADGLLASMDKAIGFNWETTVRFIDSSKFFCLLLSLAYASFAFQLGAAPFVLAMTGQIQRAQKMLIAYFMLMLISSIASIYLPALGTFASIHTFAPQHFTTQAALSFVEPLLALRNDPHYLFSPAKISGIISFPSVHAATALLIAWAFWETRWLRYPMLILNVLMVVSTIPFGSHYLVDVLAGLSIAMAAILAVSWLEQRVVITLGLPLRPVTT